MTTQKRKKVLFVITKSNWGEEVLRHFRKTLPAIFGAERKSSDKMYSVGTTAPPSNLSLP
jgi:hypothetical protein